VLAGLGTNDPELRHLARSNGVEEDARLLGYQDNEVVEGLYQLASCLALPSRYEGFGLTALEAMARGVPVACSDLPALREVTGAASLRFSPSSPTEAADAIRRLTEDRALAQRLAEAGRAQVAQFSWAAAARSTLSCYANVSARRTDTEPPGSGIGKT
jgi:glycosyltransferase involved in cell wall biosynthesis